MSCFFKYRDTNLTKNIINLLESKLFNYLIYIKRKMKYIVLDLIKW